MHFTKMSLYHVSLPVLMAAPSKSRICSSSFARIASSNSAVGMNVCVLSVLCCLVEVHATGQSLVQRSPAECDVCECDLET